MTGKRRIDKILDQSYLDGLKEKPLPDVRRMRADAEEEEALVSYERRLLQARIDILKAEQDRRTSGGGSILDRLPEILADGPSPSRGSLPRTDVQTPENPRRRVELLVSDDTLLQLPDMDDAKIEEILGTLAEAENEVSEQRKRVLHVLDALTEEIGRRYKSGEANPEDVLAQGS